MVPAPITQFVHRDNRDGTFDSICKECFATVAMAESKEELEDAEKIHVCNPGERERFEHFPARRSS